MMIENWIKGAHPEKKKTTTPVQMNHGSVKSRCPNSFEKWTTQNWNIDGEKKWLKNELLMHHGKNAIYIIRLVTENLFQDNPNKCYTELVNITEYDQGAKT